LVKGLLVMISLVRVDDRLLHGQVICAWVPFAEADFLIIASDEAAGDSLAREVMSSCAHNGLDVMVKSVDDSVRAAEKEDSLGHRVILVVGDLKDAMRVYTKGLEFKKLNIGNIHHEDGGRTIANSVIVDSEDEEIIERFVELGVSIDIRDVPATEPTRYVSRDKKGA